MYVYNAIIKLKHWNIQLKVAEIITFVKTGKGTTAIKSSRPLKPPVKNIKLIGKINTSQNKIFRPYNNTPSPIWH